MIMMEYFWSEENDIPKEMGFALFKKEHLAFMAMSALLVFLWVYLYKKAGSKKRLFLIITAFLLPAIELWKILFLIRVNRFGMGHLPLHFCSLAIYLYPLYALMEKSRIKTALGDLCCCALLPAGIAAVLFPDWTMYPIISFMSISGFIWHIIQIVFPLCIFSAEDICTDKKGFLNCVMILIIPAVLIYAFDTVFHCNYWFLLYPVPGPPEMIYNTFGSDMYLPVFAGMVLLVIFITWILLGKLKSSKPIPASERSE